MLGHIAIILFQIEKMIYFISNKKHVKIGYSKNPYVRLKQLQTAHPTKLKLLGTLEGDYNTEKLLHEIFKKNKQQGEWFSYTGNLKRCLIALSNDKDNLINSVKDFERAGCELGIRQKANRSVKRGKTSLKQRIRHIESIG